MDSFQFVSDPNGLYIRRFRDQSSRTEEEIIHHCEEKEEVFVSLLFLFDEEDFFLLRKNRRGLVKLNTKINSRDCANTRGGNFLIAA